MAGTALFICVESRFDVRLEGFELLSGLVTSSSDGRTWQSTCTTDYCTMQNLTSKMKATTGQLMLSLANWQHSESIYKYAQRHCRQKHTKCHLQASHGTRQDAAKLPANKSNSSGKYTVQVTPKNGTRVHGCKSALLILSEHININKRARLIANTQSKCHQCCRQSCEDMIGHPRASDGLSTHQFETKPYMTDNLITFPLNKSDLR